jgi:hypothetical protein
MIAPGWRRPDAARTAPNRMSNLAPTILSFFLIAAAVSTDPSAQSGRPVTNNDRGTPSSSSDRFIPRRFSRLRSTLFLVRAELLRVSADESNQPAAFLAVGGVAAMVGPAKNFLLQLGAFADAIIRRPPPHIDGV